MEFLVIIEFPFIPFMLLKGSWKEVGEGAESLTSTRLTIKHDSTVTTKVTGANPQPLVMA